VEDIHTQVEDGRENHGIIIYMQVEDIHTQVEDEDVCISWNVRVWNGRDNHGINRTVSVR